MALVPTSRVCGLRETMCFLMTVVLLILLSIWYQIYPRQNMNIMRVKQLIVYDNDAWQLAREYATANPTGN